MKGVVIIMRYWKLVLPSLLVAIMVLGLANSVSAQPPQYRVKILAPAQVEVCTNFYVDIVVEPLAEGTFYNQINIEVNLNIDDMQIIYANTHSPDSWVGSFGTKDS